MSRRRNHVGVGIIFVVVCIVAACVIYTAIVAGRSATRVAASDNVMAPAQQVSEGRDELTVQPGSNRLDFAEETDNSPSQPADQSATAASLPLAEIDASFLVGAWRATRTSTAKEGCDTDSIIHFRSDGTYRDGGAYGRYRVSGDRITYYDRVLYDLVEETEDRSEFNQPVALTIGSPDGVTIVEDGEQYWKCTSE